MELITKNKKIISIIIIAAIFFARCNLGVTYNKGFMLTNVAFTGVAILFIGVLMLKDKSLVKASTLNFASLWLAAFSVLVFIYGHYNIGTPLDFYSRQYALLTIVPSLCIMVILYYNHKDLLDILSSAGSFLIVTSLITSLIFDSVWSEWVDGTISESRVGATPAGTCVDTANIILVCLVPILYNIYANKKLKYYGWAVVLGIFQIFASGSKSSMIPLVFVFIIMIVGSSKDKQILKRNLIILAVAMVVGVVLVMTVPLLYRIIGSRFVELFTGVNDADYDLHTSTGQRMAVAAAFKEHFWEAPLFGHGFYAFKAMPYSNLEEYRENGVTMYKHLQIHNNFMEVLFSYGIVGFVLYYCFPVYLLIKTFISKNRQVCILVLSLLVSVFFMDIGLDMYYKYITSYLVYFIAFVLIKTAGKNQED